MNGVPPLQGRWSPSKTEGSNTMHNFFLTLVLLSGCRQQCGWNWRDAGSENLNIACQAARSIG